MSFQENRLIGKRAFVGLENYITVLSDVDFIQSIVNSLIIGIADLFLYFIISLILAISINELKNKFLKKFTQTSAFIPYLFSWTVIGGIWVAIFNLNGIVNTFIKTFGGDPIFFLGRAEYARPLIISMGVWRSVGYFAILYLASIVNIDPTLYEAAKIDGADRFQQILYITIPALKGTMKTIFVLLSIGVLTHFGEIFAMQNPGNRRLIRTVLIYVYETGIINFRMGVATAGATLVMIVTVILVVLSRKIVKYDS